MNLTSYQSLIEKVGIQNLNEANKETYTIVKEGSGNFTDPSLWNEMLTDADIKEAYELHVKALQQMANAEPKTEKATKPNKASKPKAQRKKKLKVKKTPTPAVVVKKVVKKAKPAKKAKARKPVAKKRPVTTKPTPVTYPVTVKRLSVELQLIKRFLNMDGKQKSMKALQLFHRSLHKTLKVHPDRKPMLTEMYKRLTATLKTAKDNNVTAVIMNLERAFKDRLSANVRGARPKLKVEYLSGVATRTKKKSPVSNGLSGTDNLFQNINAIDEHTKDTFRLKGALGKFLGDLETYKLAMSIEGDQGAGKTQLAFQLADGFADIGYNVGMFQLEIGANSNIIKKHRDKYISPANRDRVQIAGEAPQGIDTVREYASKFGVIIIDSWTKLDVDSQEFDRLRNDFEDTIWIVLFQRTSANKIRGGTKPLFDAGINIEVVKADETFVNNYAVATKNRYGQTGIKYTISSKKIVS